MGCFVCGEQGHIRQDCPWKLSNSSADSDVNKDVNQEEHSETAGAAVEASGNPTNDTNDIGQSTQDKTEDNSENDTNDNENGRADFSFAGQTRKSVSNADISEDVNVVIAGKD